MESLVSFFPALKNGISERLKNPTIDDINEIRNLAANLEIYAGQLLGKHFLSCENDFEVASVRSLHKNITGQQFKLAVDIGGNIGNYSDALLKLFVDASVHIFEPSHSNLSKLGKRFSNDPRVTIIPSAVSDNCGEGTLWSSEPGSHLSSLTQRDFRHYNMKSECSEKVKIIRFEDYWKNELNCEIIDLAKIDVEGYELSVLKGFGDAMEATRIIQFEFASGNIETKTFFKDFWYLLNEKEFNIYRITPLGLLHINKYDYEIESFTLANYLCANRRIVGKQ